MNRCFRRCAWSLAIQAWSLWLGLVAVRAVEASTQVETLLARGDYAAALPMLLALAPTHQHPATSAQQLAAAAHALALGQTYRQLSQPAEAQGALERAEQLLRTEAAPELLGSVLVELAELQPAKSTALLEEAWQVWQRCPQAPELAAAARLRLAERLLSQSDYAEARQMLEEARVWLRTFAAPPRRECEPMRVRLAQDLGQWHLVMGDFPAALRQFSEALELSPHAANILADQALALWRSGQIERAQEVFQVARREADPSARDSIDTNYASALLSWIPPASAPEVLLEQASAAAQLLKPTSISACLSLAEAYRLVSLALAQLGKPAEEAQSSCQQTLEGLELREDFHALTLAHPARRHASITRWALEAMRDGGQAQPFAKAALESVLQQMQTVADLTSESSKLAFLDPLDLTSPLLALPETERTSYLPALLGAFSLAGRERFAIHSLTEWQAILPSHACLVTYFTFRKPAGTTWLNSVAVAVLAADQTPRVLDLNISSTNLLRTVQQLRERSDADAETILATLEKLGRQLWSPVRAILPAETTRAFFCLEGALAGIPVSFLRENQLSLLESPLVGTFLAAPEALFHQASETLPLRDGPWIGVDASEVPTRLSPPRPGWEFPFSVVAQREFPRLTHVAAELQQIADLHPPQWQMGKYSEAELTSLLTANHPRVWHFAGHGVTDGTAAAPGTSLYANALLCRGVDLNQPPASDGLLFASELAKLNLASLDLAVFSACDSGRGPTQHGEAVFDLARACHRAGVRDVLVSAAPVQDAVAPLLMREFYRRVLAGMDAAQAAWEAQRSVSRTQPSLHAVGYFRLVRNQRSSL